MAKSEEEAEKCILDITDYAGRRVVFTEKKWKEKSIQHPELTKCMQKNITENKAVLSFAYNFENIVKKNNWVSRYDIDTDAFSVTVKKLPNDARLKYFGDEFAFYLTKKGQVKGIFIEYFKKNFVKHNKEVDEIRGLINKMEIAQKNDPNSLLEIKTSAFKTKIMKGLENVLEESLAKGIKLEPAR